MADEPEDTVALSIGIVKLFFQLISFFFVGKDSACLAATLTKEQSTAYLQQRKRIHAFHISSRVAHKSKNENQ